MKKKHSAELIDRIRHSFIPNVTVKVVSESEVLSVEIIQEYILPNGGDGKAIPWRKSIHAIADKDGNIISHKGLF